MKDEYVKLFPPRTREFWKQIIENMEEVREIRIRANQPIIIYMGQREISLDEQGNVRMDISRGRSYSYKEIQELIDYWCQDSRYAFQEELKKGFLTIKGGHRIGICGETVWDREGSIQTVKYISSLNIRVAHQIKHAAGKIIGYLYENGNIKDTLIISPPGAGKTTMLRDILRRISDGNEYGKGQNVGIVDERSEIASCFRGIPQLDVGRRSDVLDSCQKAYGMTMLLRSMSPNVIAVDELAGRQEVELVHQLAGCGCKILAAIHGNSMEEVREKEIYQSFWEQRLFSRILVLSRDGREFRVTLYKEGEERPCFVC